jgi:hypothetical protein
VKDGPRAPCGAFRGAASGSGSTTTGLALPSGGCEGTRLRQEVQHFCPRSDLPCRLDRREPVANFVSEAVGGRRPFHLEFAAPGREHSSYTGRNFEVGPAISVSRISSRGGSAAHDINRSGPAPLLLPQENGLGREPRRRSAAETAHGGRGAEASLR